MHLRRNGLKLGLLRFGEGQGGENFDFSVAHFK
jgi:hypothetical protein